MTASAERRSGAYLLTLGQEVGERHREPSLDNRADGTQPRVFVATFDLAKVLRRHARSNRHLLLRQLVRTPNAANGPARRDADRMHLRHGESIGGDRPRFHPRSMVCK
jgi:hypothetical protein